MMRAMLAKIFGRPGRLESERGTSPDFPGEKFVALLTLTDVLKRPSYVKVFSQETGYTWGAKSQTVCGDCGKEASSFRVELYNGIWEPEGSLFLGTNCLQTNVLSKI